MSIRSMLRPGLALVLFVASVVPLTAADNAKKLQELQQVVELLKKCLQRDASACHDVGVAYETGYGVDKDYNQAVQKYRAACAISAKFCNNLGVFYEKGWAVAQNYGEAGRLYHTSCSAGSALACLNLGELYKHNRIYERDPFLGNRGAARIYFSKACDGGVAGGCLEVGLYLIDSNEQDQRRSASYFRQACNGGLEDGCHNLRVVCSWWTFPPSGCGLF